MRIAHVTDLHLRWYQPGSSPANRRRSRDMVERFKEVLQQIRQEKVDLLVLTGDLLDAPSWLWENTYGFETDDPALWLPAVEQDYQLVKQMLDDSGLRYLTLPGNHDHMGLYRKVFNPEPIVDIAGYRFVSFFDVEGDGHFPRRFMHERARFDEVMQQRDLPQIHLQHYVIEPVLNEGYPHTYLESQELSRRLVAHGGVQLCISGHYHSGTELIQKGPTTFTVGQAFCDHPHPWRIYEVNESGIEMETRTLLTGPPAPKPVVFLDRDGVINDLASYRVGPEAMRLIPGVAKAIVKLRQAGYAVVGITSQSSIGAGYVTDAVVHSVHDKMFRLLAEEGAWLDAMSYSTGAGPLAIVPRYEDVSRVKPFPWQLHDMRDLLNLDFTGSWMIGDRVTDIQTGQSAGVGAILVRTGKGRMMEADPANAQALQGVPVVDDLAAAVPVILASQASVTSAACRL
jgi:D-glycero-D-manno-heptose 1,7-bisphosphate phosphatase